MADDMPEDTPGSPDPGRARRAGPTIDLQAHDVSRETSSPKSDPIVEPEAAPEQVSQTSAAGHRARAWPSALLAAASGAGAAALVTGAVWFSGYPAPSTPASTDTSAISALTSRVAAVESRTAALKSAASATADPAVTTRIEALEKTVASLRGDLAGLRTQSDKLAADIKSMPRDAAPPVDLTAINARVAQIEHNDRTQTAQIAQANAKPTDDAPLRRVVVASMLDTAVRHGDAYAEALAAAKSVTENSDALKPLDVFASSGVPGSAALSRDLLNLVSKLSPPAEPAPAGTGFVDRLQAGASKLVRIERTNATGNDRSAVVARITAAALRNDIAEARRELNTLSPVDRAAAQSWIETTDARDAALAVSHQFAADAMAALAKPGQ